MGSQPVETLLCKREQLVAIALSNDTTDDLGVNIQIVVHQRIAKANDLALAD